MTLVEATVIVAVVSTMAAILAPAINSYVETARQARAREDVQTIAEAIQSFVTDTGESFFLINGSDGTDGQPPTHVDNQRTLLLVSDGDIPAIATALTGETYWSQALDGATVDTLSNHLIENKPIETAGNRYRNPSDIAVGSPGGNNIDFARSASSGFNAPHSWRGPYLSSPVNPDPWGNRYAVNVAFLRPVVPAVGITGITGITTVAAYPRLDVFVLSAGPDEEIDTNSGQDGAVPGDDDIIHVVSGNAK